MFVEHKEAMEVTEAPAKVLKMSEAVRDNGYANPMSADECVLGRAFKAATGMSVRDACEQHDPRICKGYYPGAVGKLYGVPVHLCLEAEQMCISRKSPDEIANWLESKGY